METGSRQLQPNALEGELLKGTYLVEEWIGEGGMASVYKATHQILQTPVALKVLRARRKGFEQRKRRFLREARAQSNLHHTNIVRVIDFIDEGGIIGLVMEWCNHGDLEHYLQNSTGVLEPHQLPSLFFPLLDGLQYAHDSGFIHRDIKPQNVLLHEVDGQLQCKVNDFGLVKVLHEQSLTSTGVVMGTLLYVSPEQFQEAKYVDHRTDLYSLGVVLYQILSGTLPFTARMPQLGLQIINQAPPPPPEVPEPLSAVIMQCLEKSPDARYGSCRELKEALAVALEEMGVSVEEQIPRPDRLWGRATARQTAPPSPAEFLPPTGEPLTQGYHQSNQATVVDQGNLQQELQNALATTFTASSRLRGQGVALDFSASMEEATQNLREVEEKHISPSTPSFAPTKEHEEHHPTLVEPQPAFVPKKKPAKLPRVLFLLFVLCLAGGGWWWMQQQPSAIVKPPLRAKPRRPAKPVQARTPVRRVVQAATVARKVPKRNPPGVVIPKRDAHDAVRVREPQDAMGTALALYEKARKAMSARKGGQAREFLRQSCLKGFKVACDRLGMFCFRAVGGDKDLECAHKYLQKGCDSKDAHSCMMIGRWWVNGWNKFPVNRDKGIALLEKSCQLGSGRGCSFLGTLHKQGKKGLPKDHLKALKWYSKGCKLRSPRACLALGIISQKGWTSVRNGARAQKAYDRGCTLGHPFACFFLGWMYVKGFNGGASCKDANRSFQRACNNGHPYSCGMRCLMKKGKLDIQLPKGYTTKNMTKLETAFIKKYRAALKKKETEL